MRSLRFLAHKVGLSFFGELLRNSLVEAWLNGEKWHQTPAKEALPLPLFAVAQLEKALQSFEAGAADGWLLGCILLMIWGSLRWSDAQRLQLNTLACDDKSLRGWSWRSKTAVTGIPFGVSLCGATQAFWGRGFSQKLLQLASSQPARDFLVAKARRPISYACMLNQFRRCLTQYTTLSPTEAQCYSLHSCKTTVLSWALQLNVRLDWRAARGHHKSQVSDSVRKYGRNDILPQLQCQRRVLKKIALGWRPERAVQRGVQGVAEDPSLTQDLLGSATCDSTDSESSEENGAESSSDQSSSQASSDASGLADEAEEELLDDSGPWIVNEAGGCCHRAVQCAEHSGRGLQFQGLVWGIACRPAVVLNQSYKIVNDDPFIQGFERCGHCACFPE